MRQVSSGQIGSALRRLAEDLVAERLRATRLERENRELKAEVDALRRVLAERENGERKAEVETVRRVVAERERRSRKPGSMRDEVGAA